MKHENRKKWLLILYVGVYFAIHILYAKVLCKVLEMPMMVSVVIQLTSYLILGAGGIWLFRKELAEGLKVWREQLWKCFLWFAGTYVGDMVLMTVFSLPLGIFFPEYVASNENNVALLVGRVPGILLFLILGVMGPITEEVIFRLLPMRWGVPAILVMAICFGLIHVHAFTVQELLFNLPHVATGLVYGFVLYKSRNATIPVGLHVLNNSMALLGILLG